jgi:hypothetical protein
MAATATPQLERRLNVPTTSFHNAAVQTQAFGGCSVKAGFGDDAVLRRISTMIWKSARDEKAEAIVQRRIFQRPHQRAHT